MFPTKEAPASSHMLVSRAERRELDSQVSSETACFLQRKLLPVVIRLSHGLSCSKKKVSRSIPPGSALIQGNRKANEQAASEQAGKASRRRAGRSRQPRQTAAGRASRRQGRQAGKQAGKQAGRQARQADGTQISHLAQAGTQAGRQAGRQAGTQAGRQAGSFDGKEKQGRPQRKPSILA